MPEKSILHPLNFQQEYCTNILAAPQPAPWHPTPLHQLRFLLHLSTYPAPAASTSYLSPLYQSAFKIVPPNLTLCQLLCWSTKRATKIKQKKGHQRNLGSSTYNSNSSYLHHPSPTPISCAIPIRDLPSL